jgi:cell division protein FtsB
MTEFFKKPLAKIARLPRPEDGLRAVVERAPQAEEMAATWLEARIDRIRPVIVRVYGLRHRIATIVVTTLAAMLFVHVMFGANGMVMYRQKRAEYEALRKQVAEEQKQNDRYTQQIQSLKTDKQAIEKEAREQMGYARPGEFVYVATPPAKPAPLPAKNSAKK